MNLGAVLVFGALAAKLMDDATTTTTTTTTNGGTTAPPRPTCPFGKKAVYSPTDNSWSCVPKQLG